jgi:hypothetical protein
MPGGKNNGKFTRLPVAMRISIDRSRFHFSSFIFLQTIVMCPVFESILVVTGRQLQDTVFAFSCLTTTQCSISSADGGGSWLRIGRSIGGDGDGATGGRLATQPIRKRKEMMQSFFIAIPTKFRDRNGRLVLEAARPSLAQARS